MIKYLNLMLLLTGLLELVGVVAFVFHLMSAFSFGLITLTFVILTVLTSFRNQQFDKYDEE